MIDVAGFDEIRILFMQFVPGKNMPTTFHNTLISKNNLLKAFQEVENSSPTKQLVCSGLHPIFHLIFKYHGKH